MVEVAPFKGITYNKEKIAQLDDVMSPPYDIISPKKQEELYEKHPNNFVRLILGKQLPSDSETNNRYTRAKKDFNTWQNQDILKKSNLDSIYPYQISYTMDGKKKIMNGFFILLQLDKEYKQVKAHEKTLSKPKADRLELMRACHANLEPIQLLYIDEKDSIHKQLENTLKKEPMIRVKGSDQFTHSLWCETDQTVISTIQEYLQNNILFIADGHHRYQTAINYAEEQEQKTQNSDPHATFNYRMVILVNMFDEGLAILPTHRLLNLQIPDRKQLMKQIETYFTIETYLRKPNPKKHTKESEHIKQQLQKTSQHSFALVFNDEYYILRLKDESIMKTFAKERTQTWQQLDVSILHKILIEHILHITPETLEDHVKYTRVDEEALSEVDSGSFNCSILMNPTKIQELKEVAEASEHMPQKSTYFLPKMLSGLVMYKMEE